MWFAYVITWQISERFSADLTDYVQYTSDLLDYQHGFGNEVMNKNEPGWGRENTCLSEPLDLAQACTKLLHMRNVSGALSMHLNFTHEKCQRSAKHALTFTHENCQRSAKHGPEQLNKLLPWKRARAALNWTMLTWSCWLNCWRKQVCFARVSARSPRVAPDKHQQAVTLKSPMSPKFRHDNLSWQ